jgi:hypothetical protein
VSLLGTSTPPAADAAPPSGLVQLRNACDGKLLALRNGRPEPWDDVVVADSPSATTVWEARPQSDGSVMLVANGTNSAVQTAFGKKTSSTDVDVWTAAAGPTQRWNVTDIGGGYSKLNLVAAPTMALDLRARGANGESNVWLYTDNGTCAQQWKIEPVTPPATTTWYVATTGNDAAAGTATAPFASLGRAIRQVRPGETIVVRSGRYIVSNAQTIDGKRGTADKPIRIVGEGLPVLVGANRATVPEQYFRGLVSVVNSSHVSISGLRVENSGSFGFFIDSSDNVTIEQSQSAGTKLSGIWASSSTKITIVGNDLSAFCDEGQGAGCQEGLSLETVDGFDVGYNRVHDAPQVPGITFGGGEGIDAKYGTRNGRIHHNVVENMPQIGIYVDAWKPDRGATVNIEVDNNVVRNTNNGVTIASEQGGQVSDIAVHDNILYTNGYFGVAVSGYGNGPIGGVVIDHNTIYRNGFLSHKPPYDRSGNWGGGIIVDNTNLTAPVTIRDNIIADQADYDIFIAAASRSRVTITGNVIWSPTRSASGPTGSGAILLDPRFVDPPAGDFALQPGSPAAGKGARR